MTTWTSVLEPRLIAGGTAQTIRASVTNETGHVVALGGRTLRVLPDGVTTSKKRSYIIREAPTAVATANGALIASNIPDIPDLDPVAYLVGCLVLAGATNLELDGVDLFPRTTSPVQWRVDLAGDGSVHITRTDAGASE